MTLLKKMMLAASLFLVSSFASAAVYDLDLINNTVDSEVVLVNVGAGNAFGDLFNFTLDQELVVNQVLDFLGPLDFLTYSIFDSGATLIESAAVGFDGKLRIEDLTLSAGSYTTYVSGILAGSFAGYSLTAAVSPVPEASTIAMMLGGLGLVGFMARRRKAA